MRIVLVLLVFTCYLAMSNGTLKLLKSKLRGTPVIYPVARYRTLKYLSSPIVISEPLSATYAHPVYVSTYGLSSPSVSTYAAPIQTYSAPFAYASTYTVPVDVYPRPVKVAYDVSSIEPETVYIEPTLLHGGPATESHYSV